MKTTACGGSSLSHRVNEVHCGQLDVSRAAVCRNLDDEMVPRLPRPLALAQALSSAACACATLAGPPYSRCAAWAAAPWLSESHSAARSSASSQLCANEALFGFEQLAQPRRLLRPVRQHNIHGFGQAADRLADFLQPRRQMLVCEVLQNR